jgi:aminoglycoside phosphotransferase (APT) family kinase protein
LVTDKPPQRYTGVVHGDYRLGNMLADPATGAVAAVLDWELCTLGDVLADVGYLLNNWIQPGEPEIRGATSTPTRVGGFTSREEVVEAYSARTGFEVTDINYYRAFQHWRLAAIVEGVLSRYLQGVMADDSVDTDQYAEQVAELATESVRLLAEA